MTKFSLLIIAFAACYFQSHAQQAHGKPAKYQYTYDFSILKEKIIDLSSIIDSDSICYFGLDFSNFIYRNLDTTQNQINLETDIKYWEKKFEKNIVRKNFSGFSQTLQKKFSRQVNSTLNIDQYSNLYRTDTTTQHLGLDSIQKIIKSYPSTDHNGQGFAVIMEEFDANVERVIMNFVFFDTHSKNIDWYVKIQATAGNLDTTRSWEKGMNDAFFRFRKVYYKRRRQ